MPALEKLLGSMIPDRLIPGGRVARAILTEDNKFFKSKVSV